MQAVFSLFLVYIKTGFYHNLAHDKKVWLKLCRDGQVIQYTWVDPDWGGVAGGLDPPKNHNNIGFLSNSGPDALKNHKATKHLMLGIISMAAKLH